MCVILTYGISVQIKTINGTGTTVSTNAEENELRDAVLKAKEKYDNLYKELEKMETQLRTASTENNTGLTELENTIKEGNKIVGLSEVTGNGIIIKVDDNKTIPLNSFINNFITICW